MVVALLMPLLEDVGLGEQHGRHSAQRHHQQQRLQHNGDHTSTPMLAALDNLVCMAEAAEEAIQLAPRPHVIDELQTMATLRYDSSCAACHTPGSPKYDMLCNRSQQAAESVPPCKA